MIRISKLISDWDSKLTPQAVKSRGLKVTFDITKVNGKSKAINIEQVEDSALENVKPGQYEGFFHSPAVF